MKTSLLAMIVGIFAGLTASHGFAGAPERELKTVPYVDLNRYIGKWYEIAKYPNSFQRNCEGATAEYSIREDGDINVVNRCYKGGLDGELKVAKARAWVTDKNTNAKLKVRFFWPFSGKYWVIDLHPDYEYAVVGEPSRKYLWILSRHPKLEQSVYDGILSRLVEQGYDPAKLVKSQHRAE